MSATKIIQSPFYKPRPAPKKRAPRRESAPSDMLLHRGPTNIAPPTPQEIMRMKKLEWQSRRNVI